MPFKIVFFVMCEHMRDLSKQLVTQPCLTRVLAPAIPFLKSCRIVDKALGELINLFQRSPFSSFRSAMASSA